ncbi:hypothetical protein L2E82_25112 [Cichorium intybus]|uniref:Uncharacterized protein n=1 Tax=Cichorium intybus TaxID=13427 RepID=A0ACB9E2Q8_CICIN|nr:hypothetical protein L2E82_25112 [Cichorium intybus]
MIWRGSYAKGALYALQRGGNHLKQGVTGFICDTNALDSSDIEVLRFEITSMIMRDMIVTTPCMRSSYPTKAEQYHFLRHNLNPETPNQVSDKDLETVYVETSIYMLASHLYWALWDLIQLLELISSVLMPHFQQNVNGRLTVLVYKAMALKTSLFRNI